MEPFTRRINIKVSVDIWDWKAGDLSDTVDITNTIINYRFQKTIKNPKGTCQISMVPQIEAKHILDTLKPMDVIHIYEFGILKFRGYIQRLGYSGSIAKDGKPNRSATLTASQFGGILYDAKTGMGLGTAVGSPEKELFTYNRDLFKSIANIVTEGSTYKELLTTVLSAVKTYVSNLGGTTFLKYLDRYLNINDGLTDSTESKSPRDYALFTGMEQSIGVWDILEQLMEKPFNEMFVDNGPRKISLNGEVKSLTDKSNLIFRSTPFDGSVGQWSSTAFSDMESVYVDKDHLIGFNLSCGMDEVYTSYIVKNAAFDPGDIRRLLLGDFAIDIPKLEKYLFRPLIVPQYYIRIEKLDATEIEVSSADIENPTADLANTLKAWFTNNDDFMSGAISIMVPSDNDKDPKIGDKLSIYGLTGNFYIEGIAHTWVYGGALKSDLSVTRGYNNTSRITFTDKIFKRNQIQ